jgi:hypothetical protein
MNKKGMLDKQILSWIIIIVSLFIIMWALFEVLGPSEIDSETCRASVLARSRSPDVADSYVPLSCETEKICISPRGGGSCEDFENSDKVQYEKIDNIGDIEKILAEEMISCWTTAGEGKISLSQNYLVNRYGFSTPWSDEKTIYSGCIVCSRIAFDKKGFENSAIDLEDIDLDTYMRTHAVADKEISYYDYISGENAGEFKVADKLEFPVWEFNEETGEIVKVEGETEIIDFENPDEVYQVEIENDEVAVMFQQITAPDQDQTFKNIVRDFFIVGGVGAGAVGFKNAGKLVTKGGARLGVGGGFVAFFGAVAALFVQQINVAKNRNIAAGICNDVLFGEEARSGCSVVRTVNYDRDSIDSVCDVVESST